MQALTRFPVRFAAMWILAALAWGCSGDSQVSVDEMPNVLVITLDTTRADRLGCYRYTRPTSPRLDALAREGVLFERAIAQAAVTPVSHAAMFSGMYPFRSGLRFLHGNLGYLLPDDVTTLAEVLSGIGFDTGAFISAFPCGKRFGLQQGFRTFDDPFSDAPIGSAVTEQGIVNTGRNQRTALATNRSVFQWLDFGSKEPRFVWVHYFDPHDTMLIPEDRSIFEQFPARDSSTKSRLQAAYDAEIRYMDDQIGNLVKRMRMLERPLVVAVVGDHGEGLGDHDWWGHSILYQEQIRVPFILAGHGVPEGRTVEELVRTVDLAPTLLGLLGLDPAKHLPGIDGVDLGPLLRGEGEDLALEGYAEQATMAMRNEVPYQKGKFDVLKDQLFCLMDGEWKYVHHRHFPDESELYNLRTDSGETNNLAGERPTIVEGFRERLEVMGAFDFTRAFSIIGEGMSEEDRKKLEELGYLKPKDEDGE